MPSVLKKVEIVAEWKDIQVGMEGIGSALIREVLSRSSNYCVSQKKKKKTTNCVFSHLSQKNPLEKPKKYEYRRNIKFLLLRLTFIRDSRSQHIRDGRSGIDN